MLFPLKQQNTCVSILVRRRLSSLLHSRWLCVTLVYKAALGAAAHPLTQRAQTTVSWKLLSCGWSSQQQEYTQAHQGYESQ